MFEAGAILAGDFFTGVLPPFSLSVISLVNAEVRAVIADAKMRKSGNPGFFKK